MKQQYSCHLPKDPRDVDLGGVGTVWRDEVHLANLLAKGGVSLSAERLGPPLQGSLLGTLGGPRVLARNMV